MSSTFEISRHEILKTLASSCESVFAHLKFVEFPISFSLTSAMVKRVKGNILKSDKDALEKLIKKATTNIRERHMEEVELNGAAPALLSNVIAPIERRLSDVKSQMEMGTFSLKDTLEGMTDTQLAELLRVFQQDKCYTEDRLATASHIALKDDINALEQSVAHLLNLKNRLMETFVVAYTREFYQLRGGEATFDNTAFT